MPLTKKDPFSLTGVKEVKVSPLDPPAWRALVLSVGATAAAWLVHLFFGTKTPVLSDLVALLLAGAWFSAVRMLFLDAKAKAFWLAWLIGSLLFVVLSSAGSSSWVGAWGMAFIFLVFRKYRPFSHLRHRRRAWAFFLGLLAFSLLSWGWLLGPNGGYTWSGTILGWVENLGRYSLVSLSAFWAFVLLHIFFKARLHSIRIRPKLAVSTFLIAVVPLGLVVIMGLAALYSILGEAQAARAVKILESWSEIAGRDPGFCRTVSGTWFSAEISGGAAVRTEGAPPPWLEALVKAKTNLPARPEPPREEPAGGRDFYCVGNEAWLVKTASGGEGSSRAWGLKLEPGFMNRLARIVHADVQVTATSPIRIQRGSSGSLAVDFEADPGAEQAIVGRFDPSRPRLRKWFGMTHLDVRAFDGGVIKEAAFLLSLKTSIPLIRDEVYSTKNPLSQVVIGGLVAAAVLLLILEAFALFFGVRISAGITSAVRSLHAGTRRIAAGDLDTRIEVPNEDELGDLAASFNEMAAAVKRGKEEALHRERLERELSVAREIQERLLPHEMPSLAGFEISGASLPSQQVGGDYFDFLDLPDGRLGVAIADVSGKGISAALLMANLQAMLRGQAEGEADPAAVVARINDSLVRSTDPRMFATFFYGLLDRQKSVFTAVNAGHNPPLVFRRDGRLERIEPSGLIVGFLPRQSYTTAQVFLEPGDVVLLYTDGITEAFDPALTRNPDRFFGEQRLIRVVREAGERSAAEIQAAILESVSSHTARAAQNDDITLVVIRRRAEGP